MYIHTSFVFPRPGRPLPSADNTYVANNGSCMYVGMICNELMMVDLVSAVAMRSSIELGRGNVYFP